ncbi:transglutaminase domain-containing protein [Arthrobacter sp. OV608]|uniref:transglutaminase family protein n=1 Tax=Arthrobacter sp. OV608 TaxID=1882768 RepID=UPI0008B11A65|nr:transglutaminase domain-containing protein [Arthrobacter sp. OV608]SEQ81350.1 Transglutaminase-like superfamily protein [Arthrobacter sp. OV608]
MASAPSRSRATGAAIAAVGLILALLPLYPVYGTYDFWLALGGGVLLGSLVAVAGACWRLGPLRTTAAAAAVYFAAGGFLVMRSESLFGTVPTLDVLRALALGPIQVWKSMLTAATPVSGMDSLLLAPYLLAILGSVITGSITLRGARPQWATLPVGALMLAAITLSTYTPFAPAVVGAVLTVGLAAWALRSGHTGGAGNLALGNAPGGSRAAMAAATLVVALGVGLGAGAIAPLPNDRAVLRDAVVPPLDVHDLASPLTSFRQFTTGGESLKLFTVDGLPQGTAIRLATLDQYDGIVYRVATNGSAGAGQFTRIGRTITNTTKGNPVAYSVTLDQLTGVWMPGAGYLNSLTLNDSIPRDRRNGLNYNPATGTAVTVGGVAQGDQYTAEAVIPQTPDDTVLAAARVSPVTLPAPQNVPEIVDTLATQFTAGASTPWDQLKAIEAKLHTAGFFSHGLEGEARSRAGHTAERISTLLEGTQMVGDDEQYAVAMALMARQLGIPARVVMGFRQDHPTSAAGTITGADVHAWVEVPFEQIGWVSFNPTPPTDQVPKQEVPQRQQKPQPQVQQPPPPVVPPVELPPAPPVKEASDGSTPNDLAALLAALRWAGTGVGILALLAAPAALAAWVRWRRRRQRRTAARAPDRISGGWSELVDLVVDHGADVPAGATRREEAALLGERFPSEAIAPLAVRADHAAFGTGQPSDAEIAAYWADVETAARRIRRSVGWRRRLAARYFARSAMRDFGPLRAKFPIPRINNSLKKAKNQ